MSRFDDCICPGAPVFCTCGASLPEDEPTGEPDYRCPQCGADPDTDEPFSLFYCPEGHAVWLDGGRKSDNDIPCPSCEVDRLQAALDTAGPYMTDVTVEAAALRTHLRDVMVPAAQAVIDAHEESAPTDPGDGSIGSQFEAEEMNRIDDALEVLAAALHSTRELVGDG